MAENKEKFNMSPYYIKRLQNEAAELCLLYCGSEQCHPGHRYGPNRRPSYLLHFVKEGRGTLEINDQVFHLKKDDIFMIPPNVEAWYEADKEDPWLYYWVGFSGRKVEECVAGAGFSLRTPVRNIESLKLHYEDLIHSMLEASGSGIDDELKRNAFLMLLFSELIDNYDVSKNDEIQATEKVFRTEYIQYSVQFIESNYQKKIRIQDLANLLGVERTYFATCFKKVMGCSPQEYLINFRMDKATYLLKHTEVSISTAAEAVGYDDPFAFSSAFKKRYGVSPSAYRNAQEPEITENKKKEFVKKA